MPAPERPEEFPTVFQPCLQVSQGRAEPFKGLEYFLSRNPSDCPLRVPSPNSAPLSYTHENFFHPHWEFRAFPSLPYFLLQS